MTEYMMGYNQANSLISLDQGDLYFVDDAVMTLWGWSVGEDTRWNFFQLGFFNRVKTEFIRRGWGLDAFYNNIFC